MSKKKKLCLVKQEKNKKKNKIKTKQRTTPKAPTNQKKNPKKKKKNQGSISGKQGNSTKPRCTAHGQSLLLPIRHPPTQFSPHFGENFLVGQGRKHPGPTVSFPSLPPNQTSSKIISLLIFSTFFFHPL